MSISTLSLDRPRADPGAPTGTPVTSEPVLPATRRVLFAFAGLTLLATNQLLVVGAFTNGSFAWTITGRPTAAFLGAAYAAGFVLAVLALRRRDWRDVRVAFVTVTVFTGLTLVPTLEHLHKFHLHDGGVVARLAAWVWLAIYVVVPLACLVVIARQRRYRRRSRGAAYGRRAMMPGWLRSVLAVQGAVLGLVGGVLFVQGGLVHHLPEDALEFWPWRLMPLGAQVIGAWLLALAVATVLTIVAGDLRRLRVPAVTYTAFGVFQLLVTIRYADQVRPGYPWLGVYVAVLVTVALTGAYGCWASRRTVSRAGVGRAA